MADVIFFYGTECEHCHEMEPILDEVIKETRIRVDKLEVWHNEKNMQVMQACDKNRCGALPFLYNKKTDAFLCGGNKTREQIKKILQGK